VACAGACVGEAAAACAAGPAAVAGLLGAAPALRRSRQRSPSTRAATKCRETVLEGAPGRAAAAALAGKLAGLAELAAALAPAPVQRAAPGTQSHRHHGSLGPRVRRSAPPHALADSLARRPRNQMTRESTCGASSAAAPCAGAPPPNLSPIVHDPNCVALSLVEAQLRELAFCVWELRRATCCGVAARKSDPLCAPLPQTAAGWRGSFERIRRILRAGRRAL
jgi:hypothetical protein